MGVPTKSQVLSWKSGSLAAIAKDAKTIGDAIGQHADTMNRTIHGLDWSGQAFASAAARADREKIQQRAVATGYDDLANALNSAERDTGWIIDQIPQILRGLPANWTVAEDFTVTPADNKDKNQAANDTAQLQGLARTLGQALDNWAPKITDAVNAIGSLAPVSAEKCTPNPADQFTPQQAATDIAALKNGTADAATLQRLHTATTLSQEEKDALASGKTLPLPQFQYLQGISHGIGDMQPDHIAELGKNLPGNGHEQTQAALANDFRLVSDTQVASAGPDGQPDGKSIGGMKQLPDTIQKMMTRNVADDFTPDHLAPLCRPVEYKSLSDLMGKGDTAIQGSDINRGMIKQASEMAKFSDNSEVSGGDIGKDFRDVANGWLQNASGDHIAIHDAITANPKADGMSPDGMAANRMSVTCQDGGKYDGASHVMNILQHQWAPDQHGPESLFKWIGDSATDHGNQGVLAGQTADHMAHLLANNSDTLAHNMPGHDGNALGSVNPGLTRALSGSLTPYIGNFAGLDPSMTVNHSAGSFTSVQDLGKVFNVMDSNPDAARTFNNGAAQWRDYMAYQAGLHPELSSNLGKNAAQLTDAMHQGLDGQIQNLQKTDTWHATENYTNASNTYDTATRWINALPGIADTIPGVNVPAAITHPLTSTLLGQGEAWLKTEMIPLANDPTHPVKNDVIDQLTTIDKTVNRDTFGQDYLQYQGYQQQHPGTTLPDTQGQPMATDWNSVSRNQQSQKDFTNAYAQWEDDTNKTAPRGHNLDFDRSESNYSGDPAILETGANPLDNAHPPETTK